MTHEEREAWIEGRQPRLCHIEEVFVRSGEMIYWPCLSTVAGFVCGKCQGRLTHFPKESGTCTSCNSEIAVRYEDPSGPARELLGWKRRQYQLLHEQDCADMERPPRPGG